MITLKFFEAEKMKYFFTWNNYFWDKQVVKNLCPLLQVKNWRWNYLDTLKYKKVMADQSVRGQSENSLEVNLQHLLLENSWSLEAEILDFMSFFYFLYTNSEANLWHWLSLINNKYPKCLQKWNIHLQNHSSKIEVVPCISQTLQYPV